MNTQAQDHSKIAGQYGVAATWDVAAGAMRTISETERMLTHNITDQWGNGDAVDPTVHGQYMRFHPGRDIGWDMSTAFQQAIMLDSAGVFRVESMFDSGAPQTSQFFKGAQGLKDFENLIDICSGKHARTVLDIAPDLFIQAEMIRQTGEVVEEEFVELTARRLLPFTNYNTWLPQYRYDRIAKRGHGFSLPVDINSHAGIPTQKQAIRREPVYKPLYHHIGSAMWGVLELEQLAETRANGAPDFNIVQTFTQEAQETLRRTENAIAYFGWFEQGLQGLLDNDDVTKTAAAQILGANTNPEEDRALFVDTVCDVLNASIRIEAVDTILVGTEAWCYLNRTIFKSVNADSTRTLLSVIMEAITPMGVKRIEWAPEMEFRQPQATQLTNEHGFSTALANRWSGGLNQQNVIAFINSNKAKGSVAMGKAISTRPQERFRDDIEVRYIMASGGFDVRKPAAYRVLTNVGP